MNEREYYVGFDIGTGSVGWAVTDEQYNLIKINRKNAWGSVLFDTSLGAEARRINRCARRRIKRQKERLNLLRELFEEEINKVDQGFFLRLKESRYLPEDKRDASGNRPELPYSLFVDEDYTDADYHREFPTIYHLRKALILEDKEFDVRLVYLAIASILKNRGHFLANMDTDEINLDFNKIFNELIEVWNIYMGEDNRQEVSKKQLSDIESIFKNDKISKSVKKQNITEQFNKPSKAWKELISLITGGKVSLSKLFEQPEYDNLEHNKITFDDASYDENEELYRVDLDDYFEVIEKAKAVYNWMSLYNILKGDKSGYISIAKAESYEKHKRDLRILKDAVKDYGIGSEEENRQLYRKVFSVPDKGINNYSRYIGMTCVNHKKYSYEGKKCTKTAAIQNKF